MVFPWPHKNRLAVKTTCFTQCHSYFNPKGEESSCKNWRTYDYLYVFQNYNGLGRLNFWAITPLLMGHLIWTLSWYFYFWHLFCHLAYSANGAPKNMSVLLNINADRNIRTNLQSRLVTRPKFGAPTIFESEAESIQ